MEPVVIEGFGIDIDRDEVRRLLGNREGAWKGGGGRAGDAFEAALDEASGLVDPRGVYTFAPGKALGGSGIFDDLDRMAFCICTIGPALEERVSALSAAGELLEAVVLDAAGSAAAEAAARYMDARIDEAAAAEGLKSSCRASPGYGDWHISEQAGLFELLDGSLVGVTLSESLMMRPRKSVSFAKHIAKRPRRLRSENSCRNCDMDTCPYRICE